MIVQVLGCNYQRTNLNLRERLADGLDHTRAALKGLRREFPHIEAVILSTSDRVELYTATLQGDLPTRRQVAHFFARFHSLDADTILGHFYDRHGRDSIRHLFMVASNLDSMVSGEPQISSQIKLAYRIAIQQQATGPLTHAVFQAASDTARRVADETTIHARQVSIPGVAVAEFAGRVFERFDDKHVLVIGADEMADQALRHLRAAGVRTITVVDPNVERAASLARRHEGQVKLWSDSMSELAVADLIVTATGSPEPILARPALETAVAARRGRALVILDLAESRDVAPDVADLPGVHLCGVNDLRAWCARNRRERQRELPKALQIVSEEADRFMAELHFREISPVIERWQHTWREPREAELQRLLNKLPHLDERSRQEIARAMDRLTNRLFHRPLDSLRQECRHGVPASLLGSLGRLFKFS